MEGRIGREGSEGGREEGREGRRDRKGDGWESQPPTSESAGSWSPTPPALCSLRGTCGCHSLTPSHTCPEVSSMARSIMGASFYQGEGTRRGPPA